MSGTIGQCGADIMNLSLTAWLLENTENQEDYLRITTKIKTIFQTFGHVLAVALIRYLKHGPIIASMIFLVVGTISVIFVYRIPKAGKCREIPKQPPILPSIRIAANSALFRKLIASFSMLLSGRNVVAVAVLYLFQFENYPEIQTYQEFANWFLYLTIISTSLAVVSAYAMSKYLKTTDKYLAFRIVIYIYIGFAIIMIPCTIIRSGATFAVVFTVLCIYAILNICVDILRDMMTRDLIVVDEYCTGMSREATFLTVVSVPLLLIQNFIGALPLLIIFVSGNKQVDDVNDDKLANRLEFSSFTIWFVRCMTCGYLFFATAALYFIYNYQINDEKIIAINDDLKARIMKESSSSKTKDMDEEKNGDDDMNKSFHVSDLENFVLQMLNFSPVENRALSDASNTSMVFSMITRLNQAQLVLTVTACILMLSMFIYVCFLDANTYTFLFVYVFLMCSIIGLYAFYRRKALSVLREKDMDDIADSAKTAEQQRLVDKAMHVNLVEGGSEGNVFPGKSSHITSLVTSHNPISDDIIGQNLLPSSGVSTGGIR